MALKNDDVNYIGDTVKNKYLTFIIQNETFGIEIDKITEIISVPAITWVPHNPKAIKGIINLRGSIIPVIDVRLKFEKEPMEYNELTCIIVIEFEDNHIGLIVDTVNEVLYIPSDNISNPPNVNLKYQNKFIKSIGKVEGKVILILDLAKFLIM